MSPETLIERLESLGTLAPKVIEKLREQTQSSDKPVKATSILKLLIRKELISEAEARQILADEKAAGGGGSTDPDATRIAEPEDFAAANDQEIVEVAHVEESLSEVLDPEAISAVRESARVATQPAVAEGANLVDDAQEPSTKAREPGSALAEFRKRDQKDQWRSKWPYIGFGTLALLIMVGVFLSVWFGGARAEEQYDVAFQSLQNSTFEDAVKKFDEYLKDNPSHKNANLARTYRVQALMRSKFAARHYKETLMTGQELLPKLAEEEDNQLSQIRDDVGYILTESLARVSADAVELTGVPEMTKAADELDEFSEFIDNPIYLSGTARKGQKISDLLANIENNKRAVRGHINKEVAYESTMKEIKEKGEKNETDRAFRTYIELIRQYPDLAARDELRKTMAEISAKERELVGPLEKQLVVSNEPPKSIADHSVALASTSGSPVNSLREEVLTTLVNGSVYGVDGGTGDVRWRKYVGVQTTYQPVKLGPGQALVSDLLRQEISRIDTSNGQTVWRTRVEQPFREPNVVDEKIVVTTNAGTVYLIDASTGKQTGGVQLPQATNTTGTAASRLPLIYQVGSYSNLYTISTTDFTCKEVTYLGHAENSIAVPPMVWSGMVLVVVNTGNSADLLVLKPDEAGLNLKTAQIIRSITDAPISTPIAYFGRGLLLFAENGDLRVLELNPGNDVSPVTVLAKKRFDTEGERAYAAFRGSTLWAAGRALRRYKLQRSLGQFKDAEVVEPGDTFLSAPQVLDETLFHVRRRKGSAMTSLSMVDAKTLKPIWRTDVGGKIAGLVPSDDAVMAVSNQGDVFRIDRDALANDVASMPVLASEIMENLKFSDTITLDGGKTMVAFPASGAADLLSYRMGQDKSRLFKLGIDPQDEVATPPLQVGPSLMIATAKGQVARIDPQSGRIVGTPFLPPVAPGMRLPWFPLTAVGDTGLIAAHAEFKTAGGKSASRIFVLDLGNERSVTKVGEIETELPLVSPLAVVGNQAIGVLRGEDSDQLFRMPLDSSPTIANSTAINARRIDGPWMVNDLLLVQTDGDELVAFDGEFSVLWKQTIGNVSLTGSPNAVGGGILCTLSNGQLITLSANDGSVVNSIDIKQPLAGSPVVVGQSVWLPGSDGTVHMVTASGNQD